MARAKKTASASSTAPKTRGIDLQEVEARVTALDKAKRRSYDIFDIEQRVYNLEKNGSTPGPTPTPAVTDLIKRVVGDSDTGTATIKYTGKYVIWLILDSSYIDSYGFKINNVDATSVISAGVKTHVSISQGFGYSDIEIELTKDDVFSWNVQYSNRYFIMFNKVEE